MRSFQVQLDDRWIEHIERICEPSGMSVDNFIIWSTKRVVAGILESEGYLEKRAADADPEALKRWLNREGGEPPEEWDRID